MKNPGIDPNSLLLPETAEKFETVDWKFGHLIHFPAMTHLGRPGGRVNLKDLTPEYAEQLVKAGFPHLRRKEAARPQSEYRTEDAYVMREGKPKEINPNEEKAPVKKRGGK